VSYNISAWHTKELEDFRINVADLKTAVNSLKYDLEMTLEDEVVRFKLPDEHGEIVGTLHDTGEISTPDQTWLHVTEFEMGSIYSQAVFNAFKEHVFPKTSGLLKALVVWEGGDSIYDLIINDGKVTEISLI